MKKNNTAILLFSRTATAEAAAKPLSLGKRSAESVAAFLVNHAKKLTAKTQLPVFFFSEKQQRGDTFGERFANAFEDVFTLGFEHVISIGNDCLTVSTADILTAAKSLESIPLTQSVIPQGGAVFGSTTDGGAYLIGLDKSIFQKNDFQNIHWQTHSTFSELVQFIEKQAFTPFLLSEKSDIDTLVDWGKILQVVSPAIKKTLLRLFNIGAPTPLVRAFLPINDRFLSTAIALRAPPFYV